MSDLTLDSWLRAISLRVRLRRSLQFVIAGLLVWAVASSLLMILGRFVPLGWEEPVVFWSVLVCLLAGAVGALLPLNRLATARAADRDLETSDRIATSLELSNRSRQNDVESAQVQRTLAAIPGWSASSAAPMRIQRPRALAAILLTTLVLLLVMAANPMDRIVSAREAAAATIQKEVAEVKKTVANVAATDLPQEQKEALIAELERIEEKLLNATSLEQALTELARADSKLESLQRNDSLAANPLLSAADRSLEEEPLAPGIKGNLEEQLNDLARIESTLADSERGEAADRLQRMADSMKSADSELSEALAESAANVRAGNGSRSLQSASDAAAAARRSGTAQAAVSSARSEIQQARERIAAAQRSGEQGSGNQSTASSANQGNQQGQAGSRPGSGTNEGTAGQGTGGPGTANQGSGGREGGTGKSDVAQTEIYDPTFGSSSSESLHVEGQVDDQGPQTTIGKKAGPRSAGEVMVPYRDVYPAWSRRAARTVDTMPIGASLRTLIRSYFSALDPDTSR